MENATVPQTDESNLSETTKQTMKNRRIEKGKKDWSSKKSEFLEKYKRTNKSDSNLTFTECFTNEIDEEREVAIQELKDLLLSPSITNLDMKLNKFNVSNEYSIEYSNKFAKEASKVLSEPFASQTIESMSVSQLVKEANSIIEKIEKSKQLMENGRKSLQSINSIVSNPNTVANIVTN
jgi:hypothetical protein